MAIYYISPTGNDTTGNGSSGNPWATISKAHTSAASGDTIICKDGTYTWVSQTFTKSLTIQAVNTGLAIFDGGASLVKWNGTNINLSLTGLKFKNCVPTPNNAPFQFISANITATRCWFSDITLSGGFAVVEQNGLFGFSGTSTTQTFTSCIFYDLLCASDPFDFLFGFYPNSGNTIAVIMTACIIYIAEPSSNALQNIFRAYNNPTIALTLKNNILYNNSGQIVTFYTAKGPTSTMFPSPVLNNNCMYNITSAPTDTNGITSDPLFVDPTNDNFSLQITSPAIAAGDPSA